MSSTPQNRLRKDFDLPIAAGVDEEAQGDVPTESENAAEISSAEAQRRRTERLNAIRNAIASGTYDSDEILEESFGRMLESIEQDEE